MFTYFAELMTFRKKMNMMHVILLSLVINLADTKWEFPNDFQFGVSTAAYQIEGAWNESCKGENIWDHMVHTYPEKIKDRSNGDIACDSYHLFRNDLNEVVELGVNFYRFSLSWSRLLPTGHISVVNPCAVRYYTELLMYMKKNDVQAMVTLYHWDLPQPLQDLGGWPNPHMVEYFFDYANLAFKLFGPYVKYWITFNEPGEICETGYGQGLNAPNVHSSGIGDYLCGKTIFLAHAKVYHLYNNKYKRNYKGQVSISISTPWFEPKSSNSSSDKFASEKAMQMTLGWWANPIYSKKGDYPKIMKDRIAEYSRKENFTRSRLPEFSSSDVKYIRGTWDFFALNHYTTWLVTNYDHECNETWSREKDVGVLKEQDPSWRGSSVSWLKIVPWGFRKLLRWIKNEYNNPPVFITENGYADNGELEDEMRITYHTSYMKHMLEAMQRDQCNVKGYTIWSLIDNWEWLDGYTAKFGLFYVNFSDPNRNRKPKKSVKFYMSLIEARQIPANCFPSVDKM